MFINLNMTLQFTTLLVKQIQASCKDGAVRCQHSKLDFNAKFHMPSKLRPSNGNLPGGVGTGGRAGGAHAPPFFDRSVT